MSDVANAQAYTAARYMLVLGGTWMAAHNYIPSADVNEAVSAVMILGPLVWAFISNQMVERRAQEREHVAVNAGIAAVTPATEQPITVTKEQTKEIIKGAAVDASAPTAT